MPVFSRWCELPRDAAVTDDEVRRMRSETIGDSAVRLHQLLTDDRGSAG